MATSIYFDGRTTAIPGAYTKIDASGLDSVGVGATGIVVLLGTAEGGQPVIDGDGTEMTAEEILRFSNPAAVRNAFKSGDLREAGSMVFSPSSDSAIPGGAQQLICMKVNDAKASTATLADTLGGVALTLTSRDYGAFTEQLQVQVNAAASPGGAGLDLSVINNADASTETYLNLGQVQAGSTDMYTLRYDEPAAGAGGWGTMLSAVNSAGILASGTTTLAGLGGDVSGAGSPAIIEVLSSDAADDQVVTVYGVEDGTGEAIVEILTLDGTTPVAGTKTFATDKVLGLTTSAPTLGTITVRVAGGGSNIMVSVAATSADAAYQRRAMFVANTTVTVATTSGPSTDTVILSGLSASGGAQHEAITLNGTTPEASVKSWSLIETIVLGGVTGSNIITAGTAALANNAIQTTLQSANDYFNARQVPGVPSAMPESYSGFTFSLKTAQKALNPSLLDFTDASPGAQSIDGTAVGFSAILNAVVATLNANSPTVTAARGTTGLPPIAVDLFLSGGEEGAASVVEYQAALDLLKTIDVSTIVPLTGDPAIHTAVRDHCIFMAGQGRSERDGVVGLVALTGSVPAVPYAPPTKTSIKDQVLDLNTRHLRACGQSISRYNTAGTLTVFPSYFQAALVAGMQAGSPVGTSLTRKTMSIVSFANDASWKPVDDANEMIQSGLWFLESHRTGTRCVRNITTYLQDNNVAFTEASVNEATNFAVFNFRNQMDTLVGQPGFAGTVAAARAGAEQILNLMVAEGVLVQWQSLQLELNVDTLAVSVEIAPVIPINFVTATVHLVTLPISG